MTNDSGFQSNHGTIIANGCFYFGCNNELFSCWKSMKLSFQDTIKQYTRHIKKGKRLEGGKKKILFIVSKKVTQTIKETSFVVRVTNTSLFVT